MRLQLVFNGKTKAKVHRLRRNSMVGQLVIILIGVELLFFASFTAFDLPTATGKNLSIYCLKTLRTVVHCLPARAQKRVYEIFSNIDKGELPAMRYTVYVPQVPLVIFLGYTLGWPLAAISASLFFLIGLAGPWLNLHPFAGGGGVNYYLEPGFGYLLGMIVACGAVGAISKDRRTSVRQISALLIGLAIIHLMGLAYLLGVCIFFSVFEDLHSSLIWSQWISEQARNLTWYTLPYDFLLGLALIGFGFPFRWLSRMLIAPDIASRTKDEAPEKLESDVPMEN